MFLITKHIQIPAAELQILIRYGPHRQRAYSTRKDIVKYH
jgi:hypothetical protein